MKDLNIQHQSFWNQGNGRDFLKWADLEDTNLPKQNIDDLFHKYDHKVDDMVEKWLQDGSFKSIMNYLHHQKCDEKLPDNFLALSAEMNKIPDWVDFLAIKKGEELSQRSGLTGLLILRSFSLTGGYLFSNLTKPLIATGSLEKKSTDRLHNTLGFWVEVSRSDENAQINRVKASIRTRLVHSASRITIKKKFPDWDYDQLGIPINHADMIATNIAFTVYYLYGLKTLKFDYSAEEEAGIFHLWKYVTWLLGVPENQIPNNRQEALAFFKSWTAKQGSADCDSISLTKSLLEENTPIEILRLDIINQNLNYIYGSVSNYLLDDFTLKSLKIPKVRFKNIIPNALKLKNQLTFSRSHQIISGNEEQISVLKDYKNQQHLDKV